MSQSIACESPVENLRRDISGGTHAGEVRSFLSDLDIKFCWCPAGSCWVGEPAALSDPFRTSNQKSHRFEYGFWLSQTVVTQHLWTRLCSTKPWWGEENVREGADYPATFISWYCASYFCDMLTEREDAAGRLPYGWRFRLPRSPEWEYACRAGTTTFHYFSDDIEDISPYAWFDGNTVEAGEPYPHQVGLKLPNPWGLFDMHGNVHEWCEDVFREDLSEGEVIVRAEDEHRAYRGGSWDNAMEECRSDSGCGDHPYLRNAAVGFRLALSVGRFY